MRVSLRGVGTLAIALLALSNLAAPARAETNVLAAKSFISASQSVGVAAATAASGPVSSPAAAALSAGMAELSVLRGDLAEAFAAASTLSTEQLPLDILMAINDGLGMGRGLRPTGIGPLVGGHAFGSNRAPHHARQPTTGQRRGGGGGGGGGGHGGGHSAAHLAATGLPSTGHSGGGGAGNGTHQNTNSINNLHLSFFPKGLGVTGGGVKTTPKTGK